jgi:hypothetical protein
MIEQALDVELGSYFAPDLQATAAEAKKLNQKLQDTDASAWAPEGLAAHLDTATIEWVNNAHGLAQIAYRDFRRHDAGAGTKHTWTRNGLLSRLRSVVLVSGSQESSMRR